jgi:small-conductance mechanosensitive channel
MTWVDVLEAIRRVLDVRLFEIGETSVTVSSVATFVVLVILTLWISSLIRRLIGRGMQRAGVLERGTVALVQRGAHYLVLLAGVAVALQTIGISLTTVFAAGAVVAVAIGFALQNILQNFVSGIILLAERTIKETDVLEVDNRTIQVEQVGVRATIARTRDDERIIIPNSILVQSVVANYTLADSYYRVRSSVGVTYGSDMRQVREVLERAAAHVGGRSHEHDPVVLLKDFADSSVVWEVSVWTGDPWRSPRLRSDLNESIWWALKDEGITIAFPQLDLHFPEGVPQPAAVG